MILYPRDDEEFDAYMRQLMVINTMRLYPRHLIEDTPWIQTRQPRPEYL